MEVGCEASTAARQHGVVVRGCGMAASVSLIAALALAALGLAGCTTPLPLPSPTPLPSTDAAPPASAPTPPPAVLQPTGDVEVIASGLDVPWSILRLPNGGVLVSERDTANIVEVLDDGSLRVAGTVPGVVPAGEGGLMGLAFLPSEGERPDLVYAMYTAASDNRIVRMPLTGEPGSLALGAPEPVLTGIAKAGNHDGGRLAFGPDGFLYATAGDAGNSDAAQDPASLSGKILRMTPDGAAAPGNPFGNLVWSLGHRNVPGHRVGRPRRPVGDGVRPEHVGRAQSHRARRQLRLAGRRRRGGRRAVPRPCDAVAHRRGEPERSCHRGRHPVPRGAPRRAALDRLPGDVWRAARRDAMVRRRIRPAPRCDGGA